MTTTHHPQWVFQLVNKTFFSICAQIQNYNLHDNLVNEQIYEKYCYQ